MPRAGTRHSIASRAQRCCWLPAASRPPWPPASGTASHHSWHGLEYSQPVLHCMSCCALFLPLCCHHRSGVAGCREAHLAVVPCNSTVLRVQISSVAAVSYLTSAASSYCASECCPGCSWPCAASSRTLWHSSAGMRCCISQPSTFATLAMLTGLTSRLVADEAACAWLMECLCNTSDGMFVCVYDVCMSV